MFFCKIKELNTLENQKEWSEALLFLNNMWQNDKDNADVLLRLATECWFVLSNSDMLNVSNDVYDKAKEMLKETLCYNTKNLCNHKNNLIFGYIISLDPSYFCKDASSDEEYLYYENLGKQLIEQAYNKSSDNVLFATLYFGTDNKFLKQYKKSRKKLQLDLDNLFSDETEVERYFLEVLSDHVKECQK